MNLTVKPSQIPNAGMGLFTEEALGEGSIIVEYTGEITSWAKVKEDWQNVYIYFVTDEFVINAKNHPESYARYANDAEGLTIVKGLHNNSEFTTINEKIYIRALKNIPAGDEIFVGYGEDYWETIKRNTI
ncbi:MAG: SET domain-containing protein-lysine N-methyltransferase [Chitinophagaceae bacterium]|nr:SET domain-containing protein-lysine N-methyltransferase [Chitinophagaceae bacterium]